MHRLRPWSSNLGKRLVKSPKTYLIDTGLVASLIGRPGASDLSLAAYRGALLENFAVVEIAKQLAWSDTAAGMYHYRTHDSKEVDVVLEAPDARIVGIEVKAGEAVRDGDFDGLRHLRSAVGGRFVRGVVLYTGTESLAFDDDLIAAPIASIWRRS